MRDDLIVTEQSISLQEFIKQKSVDECIKIQKAMQNQSDEGGLRAALYTQLVTNVEAGYEHIYDSLHIDETTT